MRRVPAPAPRLCLRRRRMAHVLLHANSNHGPRVLISDATRFAAASWSRASLQTVLHVAAVRAISAQTTNQQHCALSMGKIEQDPDWPGTSVPRLRAITERVLSLTQSELNGPWPEVRRRLLWAGGLRDIPATSHAFNDYNHCDLTPMADSVQDESNADGAVAQISRQNLLGPHIRQASLPDLGPGGSWSTCTNGCGQNPPSDVAHVQFRSRIAFKLVWVPPTFETFVLVDDEGKLLAKGVPQPGSGLPHIQQRKANFDIVRGGRYATEAEKLSHDSQ